MAAPHRRPRRDLRKRFVHVVDLYPTILEAAGVERPDGVSRPPPEAGRGREHRRHLRRRRRAPTRTSQYFELGGQRALSRRRLAAGHPPRARQRRSTTTSGSSTTSRRIRTSSYDLAAQAPGQGARSSAASGTPPPSSYGVFPLDDRNLVIKMVQDRQRRGIRPNWDLAAAVRAPRGAGGAARLRASATTITVELVRPPGRGDGVLLAHGSSTPATCCTCATAASSTSRAWRPWNERIESDERLPDGPLTVRYVQTMTARPFEGSGALYVGDARSPSTPSSACSSRRRTTASRSAPTSATRSRTLYRGAESASRARSRRVRIAVDTTPFNAIETMRFINAMSIRI